MAMDMIDNVSFDPAAADMTQEKIAIFSMALGDLLGQCIPVHGLLARCKLPTLVHMVAFEEGPFLELLLEMLEFPRVKPRQMIHKCCPDVRS
jgi:hypothetical protein